MAGFCRAAAPAALSNVLALLVLKTWAPGVPDFYQGTELVAPTLTDPDNRGPVDFSARRALLEALPEPSAAGAAELLAAWPDGRLKLYVTRTLLHERRRQRELFASGSYEPLAATTTNAVAFLRRRGEGAVLAAIPRLTQQLVGSDRFATGDDTWGDAEITLPDGSPSRYRDLLTGQLRNSDSGRLRLGDLFRFLPVAALRAEPGS
jgi:(1->4)-alpha-D-glucan 1-alpha-D-glucosylmutase